MKNKSRNIGPSKTIFSQGLSLIVLLGIVLSSLHFYLVLPLIPEVRSAYPYLSLSSFLKSPIRPFLASCILPYGSLFIVGRCIVRFCKAPSRQFQIIAISAGTVLAVLFNYFLVYLTLMMARKLSGSNFLFISLITNVGMFANLVIIDIAIYFNRFEELGRLNKSSTDADNILRRIENLWTSFLHLALAIGAATVITIGIIWSSPNPGEFMLKPIAFRNSAVFRSLISVVFATIGLAIWIFLPLDRKWKEWLGITKSNK